MRLERLQRPFLWAAGAMLAAVVLTNAPAAAAQPERSTLIITSTNDPTGNAAVVFKLDTLGAPSLYHLATLPTGGKGGASGNAGIVQFSGPLGAVANYGSSTVSQLVREGDSIAVGQTIRLAEDCVNPDSVALTEHHLYVVGTNCAESHAWPDGYPDGRIVALTNNSAGQIAVGETWAAVTLKAVTATYGGLLSLPLARDGALNGESTSIPLPSDADNTPLGAAFWGDILGFNPAHSPDSFAIVDESQNVFPVAGPTPSYPSNAPCWVVKGPGNVWYAGNSPGEAVSIFFSDSKGGVFYKSVPVPDSGVPTDIAVSPDGHWLAVIYTGADGSAHVAVYSIDSYGDLTQVAKSPAISVSGVPVAAFSGVAISQ